MPTSSAHSTPAGVPAYYLGRPARRWLDATRRRPPTPPHRPKRAA